MSKIASLKLVMFYKCDKTIYIGKLLSFFSVPKNIHIIIYKKINLVFFFNFLIRQNHVKIFQYRLMNVFS